jgi:hypothetical protein
VFTESSMHDHAQYSAFTGISYVLAVPADRGLPSWRRVKLRYLRQMRRWLAGPCRPRCADGSELSKSLISFGVVRPTGIFPIFDLFLAMARRGVAWIPGDGRPLTNPVHPLDVAEACVEVLTLGNGVSLSVGGPDLITREEITRMAFQAVGKKARILHIPRLLLLASAALTRPLHPHLGEVLEFATRAYTSEFIAPPRGRRHLADYFAERAALDARSSR